MREPEVKGLRVALELLEPVLVAMTKACVDGRPHNHQHLRNVQRAMRILNDLHGDAVAEAGSAPGAGL
jgi:hypothetical protein